MLTNQEYVCTNPGTYLLSKLHCTLLNCSSLLFCSSTKSVVASGTTVSFVLVDFGVVLVACFDRRFNLKIVLR